MKKALIHVNYYDFDQYRENQYIVFDERIEKIGSMNDFSETDVEITDCKGLLVMPSLVLGHTHIYSAFARGLSVMFHPESFSDILKQLWWKMDAPIDHRIAYESGIIAAADFLKNGVTTIMDHHASGTEIIGTLDELKKAVCKDMGMRGTFCFEVSDRFKVEDCISENRRFLDQKPDSFCAGTFGLHASMTLSDKTLGSVKEQLKGDPIHIHVAESREDVLDCEKRYGLRIIDRLDRFGLLTPGSLFVHGLYLHEEELALIRKNQGHLVLNVTSNMNNGVGLPNFNKIKESGVSVIIGNDGISASAALEYLNLYYAAHLQGGVNSFSFNDLIGWINQTYQVVGDRLGIRIGKIRPGYSADLLTIPYQPATPMNEGNAFGHLFFGLFPAFRPNNVFVNGEIRVKDYEISKNMTDVYEQAQKEAIRLWDEIKRSESNEPVHHI